MAYVKEEGIYRCRLQLDPETSQPCIDTTTHYAWDAVNKCFDETKDLGGVQIVLRADAYRVLDNGELSPTCEELSLENFGITIITQRAQGCEAKRDIIANFVRIFGLKDAKELLGIAGVDPQRLASAVFDVRLYYTTGKNGKQYKNYWFAPCGEAERKARSFVKTALNKSALTTYCAQLASDCKDLFSNAPAPAPSPTLPASKPAPAPSAPAVGLPPRVEVAPTPDIDLNKVWSLWISANPADTQGNAFYEAIARMYGNRDASSLSPYELSAFVKANGLPVGADDDDENPPF